MLVRSPPHDWQQSVTESVALPPGLKESIVLSTQSNPILDVAAFGAPRCSRCGKPMRLTCIEPGKQGFDLRTFECARCSADKILLVAI